MKQIQKIFIRVMPTVSCFINNMMIFNDGVILQNKQFITI